ncbi:MAG: hypothetical protein M3Y08_10740 [Fibrobacterota bacterium]|nr:hypothetical protein [Fibrobacterota bacterium]
MKYKTYLPLATFAFLALTTIHSQEIDSPTATVHRNAIYASPITMIVSSATLDFPVISIAYERSLTKKGLSLVIPFHAGWLENQREKKVAIGSGLGFRKYFGHAFAGTYLTAQSDYTHHYFRGERYVNSVFSPEGNLISEGGPTYGPHTDYLSISQLSFGYKWLWNSFTLDLSGGGAFYARDKEKYTNFIASANVGFPFNADSFGF